MHSKTNPAFNIVKDIVQKFVVQKFVEFGPESYTRKHSFEVARLAKFIANQMRLEPWEKNIIVLSGLVHDIHLSDSLKHLKHFDSREFVEVAALVHDVGKLPLRDLFAKKELFSEEDLESAKEHPVLSANEIKSFGSDYAIAVAEAVIHHHERWDGQGYPFGKKGEEIPLAARIIAVADAFHAMTSERDYRLKKNRQEKLN